MIMNKREYAQANKVWLEAKAKEEGVKTHLDVQDKDIWGLDGNSC